MGLQLLALELKLLFLYWYHQTLTLMGGEIKDEIRTFKYPVGYIDVNVEHPYQMPLV